MDKVACFIPIKTKSERVPSKNFRKIKNKKLYEFIIEAAIKSDCFDDIFIDSDSQEIKEYCLEKNISFIERKKHLLHNDANGNHLLEYWIKNFSEYKYYFQLFATAPFLSVDTIRKSVETLSSKDYNSILTVNEKCGWYWFEGEPINYQPKNLPRSQDAKKVFAETTGLYGITKEEFLQNNSRIGTNPCFFHVSDIESVDIDSEYDFKIASLLLEG